MSFRVLGCLARDTFRQAGASRVAWLILGLNLLCVAFCLSLEVEPGGRLREPGDVALYGADDRPLSETSRVPGSLRLAFGGIRLPLFRGGDDEVALIRALLAKWVAGGLGTLLALIWTAGFLPEFLQPAAALILLSKPVPRWQMVVGKYLGVVAFVGSQAAVFVAGTWLALGVRTGDWTPAYLWSFPLLLMHFAVVYSSSTLLGVATRSTVATAFGSVVFWTICYATNQGHYAGGRTPAESARGFMASSDVFRATREAAYWILPKPADFALLLDRLTEAGGHLAGSPEFDVATAGSIQPAASIAASVAFAVAMLAIAGHELERLEY